MFRIQGPRGGCPPTLILSTEAATELWLWVLAHAWESWALARSDLRSNPSTSAPQLSKQGKPLYLSESQGAVHSMGIMLTPTSWDFTEGESTAVCKVLSTVPGTWQIFLKKKAGIIWGGGDNEE